MQNSSRRRVLVTGSNKGIGLGIVESLLAGNTYDVILTSRNAKLGEEAFNTLKKKYTHSASALTYHQLDVNDDKSIDHLVDWLKKTNGKLDVLVNNAALAYVKTNDQEKELTIKTNFINTVKLTNKLLPFLTDDAKIINISSSLGQKENQSPTLLKALDEDNLTEQKILDIAKNISKFYGDYPPNPFTSDTSYAASKVLINTWTRRILVNKLKKNQQSYAVHPGLVATDMSAGFVAQASDELLKAVGKPLTTEEGADTTIYLINLPYENNPEFNGNFFEKRKILSY